MDIEKKGIITANNVKWCVSECDLDLAKEGLATFIGDVELLGKRGLLYEIKGGLLYKMFSRLLSLNKTYPIDQQGLLVNQINQISALEKQCIVVVSNLAEMPQPEL